MAGSSNFKIFDENLVNIMDDATYDASTYRTQGAVSGIAPSNVHNKLYRQVSAGMAALMQVAANRGYTVSDLDYNGLITALTECFPELSNTILKRDTAYSVGDIVYSENMSTNLRLQCTTAGTTASTEPTFGGYGASTTDGTVVWYTRDVKIADSCTGNAATATKLATARLIGSASFDGSANITLTQIGAAPIASPTLTGITNTSALRTTSVKSTGRIYTTGKDTSDDLATIVGGALMMYLDSSAGGIIQARDYTTSTYLPVSLGANGVATTILGQVSIPETITASGGFIGNSSSATKLQTARTINGVSFDGTANITIAAGGITASSLATNGYATFANGLIIQWGKYTNATIYDGNNVTITFPITFPSGCFNVSPTLSLTTYIGENACVYEKKGSTTTTSFIAVPDAGSISTTGDINYIAIGH